MLTDSVKVMLNMKLDTRLIISSYMCSYIFWDDLPGYNLSCHESAEIFIFTNFLISESHFKWPIFLCIQLRAENLAYFSVYTYKLRFKIILGVR